MKCCVCIPSYRRPIVETLKYLPFAKVFIDKSDEAEYRKTVAEKNLAICPDGIQGNVARVRNYILDEMFKAGFDAVCIIDDDMKGIGRYDADGKYGKNEKMLTAQDFMRFLEINSRVCLEWGYKLWGINCNFDLMGYRQYTPFSTVSFVGGPFSVHLKNPIRYDEDLPLKEDYDLTIQHCQEYRGVLRLNMYHYYVKQAENTGGCATYRTNKREKEQFQLLQKKWGSSIVKADKGSKRAYDFNPVLRIPIKGV